MLLQFVVENFLSFRDAATLSLLAAEDVEHAPGQLLSGPEGRDVLRCAAIYGANASGKSNLARAIEIAQDLILRGTRSGKPIKRSPFKLDPTRLDAPSRFELEVGAAEHRYSYGFAVTDTEVQAEWLFISEGDSERLLFEREATSPAGQSTIRIGEALAADAERQQFLRFVAEGTRPNQLFVTEARERNVVELNPFIDALQAVTIIWPGAAFGQLAGRLVSDASFRSFVGTLLQEAGTGVEGIDVESSVWTASQLPHEILEAYLSGASLSGEIGTIRPAGFDKLELLMLQGVHRTQGDQPVKLGLDEESDGTRRLLHLAPALYFLNLPGKGDRGYIIDELERSLHPLLTRLFLERFLAPNARGQVGQLIFTTHDTNLLDLSLLSRDSIWFTEKDDRGASTLYSLAEYKADQLEQLGAHLEQGYLQGRFGAIPFFGDAAKLRWTKKQGAQP